jgi:hypothetical protein
MKAPRSLCRFDVALGEVSPMSDLPMEVGPFALGDRVELLKSIQYEGTIFNAGLSGKIVGIPDDMFAVKFDAALMAPRIYGKYLKRVGKLRKVESGEAERLALA